MREIISEIAPVDNSKLPYDQLLRKEVQNELGLEGQALEDAITEQLAKHEERTTVEKIREENALKAKFKSGVKESAILAEYQKNWKAAQDAIPKPPTQAELKAIEDADLKAIEDVLLAAKGGFVDGIEITDEVIKEVKAAYNPNSIQPFIKKDNTINGSQFALNAIRTQNIEAIKKASYEQGVKDEQKKNANIGTKKTGAAPPGLGTQKSVKDALTDGLKEAFDE